MNMLDIFRSLAALMITIGLMLGALWLLRKYGVLNGQNIASAGAPKRLKLKEQLWLDAGRSRLLLIECDGNEHLVLISPNGAQNLNINQKVTES